ncbi:MAG TPA: OmpH family outer membrane protein [Puia sp.]|jgi:outer membrane protein|nr:OmpH family outer membrane protein [Puia sp.]
MRNIAMVPGLLALLLTGVLFYVVYHKPQPAPAVISNDHSNQPANNNLRMAYFNLDSLEAHYQYFKDVLDQVKGKENEMNAELSSMEKSYQKKIAEWQKKAPTMSQTEGQEAQQEYAQMQQNYQIRKQTLQESLMKHNEDLKTDIRRKIEEYLKDYNKSKGYNYIISYDANSFIYLKDTANNITDDLVNGLNAAYKKKK